MKMFFVRVVNDQRNYFAVYVETSIAISKVIRSFSQQEDMILIEARKE